MYVPKVCVPIPAYSLMLDKQSHGLTEATAREGSHVVKS